MAADDVASAVGRAAVGTPVNGVIEVAGPERFRLDEFIRRGLSARNDPRSVVADPQARYFGAELGELTLVPGADARLGQTRFEEWLGHPTAQPAPAAVLKDNEFRVSEVPPGSARLVGNMAVFNVAGRYCATQAKCTHRQGPLSEGTLDGSTVTCPWHGSQFDVCTGAVLRGPARDPIKTCQVTVEGEIGRIEPGAPAAAGALSQPR